MVVEKHGLQERHYSLLSGEAVSSHTGRYSSFEQLPHPMGWLNIGKHYLLNRYLHAISNHTDY